MTEKFFVALKSKTVPIVYGASRRDYEAGMHTFEFSQSFFAFFLLFSMFLHLWAFPRCFLQLAVSQLSSFLPNCLPPNIILTH